MEESLIYLNGVKEFKVDSNYSKLKVGGSTPEKLAKVQQDIGNVKTDIEGLVSRLEGLKETMGENDSFNEQIDMAVSGLKNKKDDMLAVNGELAEAINKLLEYIFENHANKVNEATKIQQGINNIKFVVGDKEVGGSSGGQSGAPKSTPEAQPQQTKVEEKKEEPKVDVKSDIPASDPHQNGGNTEVKKEEQQPTPPPDPKGATVKKVDTGRIYTTYEDAVQGTNVVDKERIYEDIFDRDDLRYEVDRDKGVTLVYNGDTPIGYTDQIIEP